MVYQETGRDDLMIEVWGLVRELTWALADVFLPATCISCKQPVTRGIHICNTCVDSLQTVSNAFRLDEYNRKFSHSEWVDDFFPGYVFQANQPVQEIIHAVKYSKRISAGKELGKLLGEQLKHNPVIQNCTCIIPIPLHRSKLYERGYNQAGIIAEGLCDVLNIPICKNVVKRVRPTKTQTRLNLQQRKENMADAFVVKHTERLLDQRVLLVDDVITTGATVSECARIIKLAGAKTVIAASAAVADRNIA